MNVIKAIKAHVDPSQRVLDEVKLSHGTLDKTVSDITWRLATVEARVNELDQCQGDGLHEAVAEAIRGESAELHSRLDDFEDRDRRDNVLFYNLEDNAAETSAQ